MNPFLKIRPALKAHPGSTPTLALSLTISLSLRFCYPEPCLTWYEPEFSLRFQAVVSLNGEFKVFLRDLVDHQRMINQMDESRITTIEPVELFLAGNSDIEFLKSARKPPNCSRIAIFPRTFPACCAKLSRPAKSNASS